MIYNMNIFELILDFHQSYYKICLLDKIISNNIFLNLQCNLLEYNFFYIFLNLFFQFNIIKSIHYTY
jgi:hypothetical protein